MKVSCKLTWDHVAKMGDTCTIVAQDDTRLEGITLFFDPDTVRVAAWDILLMRTRS